MKKKEITALLGLTNINDAEFNVFAATGISAENLTIINNMLTIMRSFHLMNKRKGLKVKLKQQIEEYLTFITEEEKQ
ncbi:MAG: hypothetical protein LBF69_05955 [Prevotellaceae bacterium]|jgi:hypothetical protein|nr:hypothetical protein [Prevotellaceae bacterium]